MDTIRFIRFKYFLLLLGLAIGFFFASAKIASASDYKFTITAVHPTNGSTDIPISLQTNTTGQSCSTQNNYAACTMLIGLGISNSNPQSGIGYPNIDESSINSSTILVSSPNDSGIYVRYSGKGEGCCGDFYHRFSVEFVNSSQAETMLKPNSTYTITLKGGENGLKAYYSASGQRYEATLDQDYSWSFSTGGDTVPPRISVGLVPTTNNTATFSLTTSEPATVQVLYGLTTDYGKSTSISNLASNHSVKLSDLEQRQTYNYKITAKDALGNENYTTGKFTTLGVNNVQISSIDNNSAVITWITNRNTDSYIEYGTSTNYGLLEGNNTPTVNHSVRLVNLASGTDYNLRIKATESSGISYFQNYSFKTTGEKQSSTQTTQTTQASASPAPSPTLTPVAKKPTPSNASVPNSNNNAQEFSDTIHKEENDVPETGTVAGDKTELKKGQNLVQTVFSKVKEFFGFLGKLFTFKR